MKLKILKNNQRGMTLVEIMIVIAILGGLMTLLATKVMPAFQRAKIKQAYLGMGELSKALDMYYTDCNQYPTAEQGLHALLEQPSSGCAAWGPDPYIKKSLLKDPWNHDYIYELQADGTPLLKSMGKDGKKELTSHDSENTKD